MDVKQMIRLVIKVIGFIYWFVFLYLGSLMVVDWSGFMSQHDIETPLFLNILSVGRLFCNAVYYAVLEEAES